MLKSYHQDILNKIGSNKKLKSLYNIIRATVKVTFFAYLCLVIGVYFLQDSMIFFPKSVDGIAINNMMKLNKNIEAIEVKTKDNVNLSGWFVKSKQGEPRKIVFYFGGNAEEVSHRVDDFLPFSDWSFVLINYRGYGNSEGKPSEENLYNDSIEVYDYFSKKLNQLTDKIVFMGRSLGTGIATFLSQHRKADGIILTTPYDNLENVAKELYPFLPVKYLLRHKFDSIGIASQIDLPVLILAASNDRTIPPWHAKDLAEKWKGEVNYQEIKDYDHNTITSNKSYWDLIGNFLNRFK